MNENSEKLIDVDQHDTVVAQLNARHEALLRALNALDKNSPSTALNAKYAIDDIKTGCNRAIEMLAKYR